MQAQIRKRKERAKGKRIVLKDLRAISMEAVYNTLTDCQKATQRQTKKVKQRRSKRNQDSSSSEEEEEEYIESELEEGGVEIQDCIEVIAL